MFDKEPYPRVFGSFRAYGTRQQQQFGDDSLQLCTREQLSGGGDRRVMQEAANADGVFDLGQLQNHRWVFAETHHALLVRKKYMHAPFMPLTLLSEYNAEACSEIPRAHAGAGNCRHLSFSPRVWLSRS